MVRGWFFRSFKFLLFIFPLSATLDPYLLPDHHSIKPLLDAIFSSSRATFSLDTLREAGFNKTKPRHFTKLLVTTHPALPGYIFKLYLDVQRFYKDKNESYYWLLRCQGAEKIRKMISRMNFDSFFKVPQKWIYKLPENPPPPNGYYKKLYILVEENMEIFSEKENLSLWSSELVTFELLKGLYKIVKKLGLTDCLKPDNIPFSYDGKIAFIDTQTFDSKVDFKELKPFLSPKNQLYWEQLQINFRPSN